MLQTHLKIFLSSKDVLERLVTSEKKQDNNQKNIVS